MDMIEQGFGAKIHGLFSRAAVRRGCRSAAAVAALLPAAAQAAHSSETIDTIADVLTWVVIIVVPLVGIAAFLMVHVIPEKIAEKKHHPQATAIKTLCFLSLVFGGLLWPLAWLWAYSKPVFYKLAYGTDKVDPHAEEHAAAAGSPADVAAQAAVAEASAAMLAMRDELQAMQQRIERLAGNLGTGKTDGKGTV
jgi:CBS domain containing-hemolysin-like protein